MLDAKDLEAIANLFDAKMDAKFEAFEAKMDAKMDAKLEAFETNLLEEVDKRIEARVNKCESNLLTEMERLYQRTNEKIDIMNKRIDKLESRYYAIKVEQNNTALIMQMITVLQRDVEEIKAKIA